MCRWWQVMPRLHEQASVLVVVLRTACVMREGAIKTNRAVSHQGPTRKGGCIRVA
jgi:uracil phosphoribosyltransferase